MRTQQNKEFKVTLQLMLVLMLVTTLVGCTKVNKSDDNTKKSPEQTKTESIAISIEENKEFKKTEEVEEEVTTEETESVELNTEKIELIVKEIDTQLHTTPPPAEENYIIKETEEQSTEVEEQVQNTEESTSEVNNTEDTKHIHIYKTIEQDSTCEEHGIIKKVCKKCGNIKSTKIIEAKGHKEKTLKGYKETCESDGLTDGVICKTCDKILVEQQVIKGGHISVKDAGISKTCISDGLTDGEHCSRCNIVLIEQQVIKGGHELKHIESIDKTCTSNGYTSGNKCLNCDYTEGLEEIVATGHIEATLIGKEATCLEDGITEGKKCTICNEILVKQEVIKATGHKEKILNRIEPTCTETGLTEGKICDNCEEVLVAQIEIPATDISIWDKQSLSEPSVVDGYLIINFAEELAWVSKYQNTKCVNKIKLGHTLDMSNETLASLPNNIEEIDGNNKRLENIKLNETGLIKTSENTKNLKVYNFTISNCEMKNYTSTGLIVGAFKGNADIRDITIINSNIASKESYSGGLIGEYTSQENQEILIENINIHNTKIDGCLGSGKILGLYEGYNTTEVIKVNNFNYENLELSNNNNMFNMNNQSCFLNNIDNKYNNIVSDSKYFRGKLELDGSEFIPRWDGKTTVEPLKYNDAYYINNSFELAGLRELNENISKVELKQSIDMNGQGEDGKYNIPNQFASKIDSSDDNIFKPFNKITYLDGSDNTIYNLKIEQLGAERGAFILTSSGETTHKNTKFNNCCTVVTHKEVQSDAKAYGAILIASVGGSNYKAESIELIDCKVYALQKVGMLIGYLGATNSLVDNCKVVGGTIENYKCNISERFDSGNKTFQDRTVRLYADFYPQGEVGGLIGFVMSNSKISNSSVTSCKINASGQDDKMATVTGSTLGQIAIAAAGYYKVPGRHVGELIGDVRAKNCTVNIDNCEALNNTFINRHDKHNNYEAILIGQAYYVRFMDTAGSVKINGKQLTLADCNKNTVR